MRVETAKTDLDTILPLRQLYLQETNTQIRYNASHERGWTDSYQITIDGEPAGYGSVMGQEIRDRDTLFEFYCLPPVRRFAPQLFGAVLEASGATFIECQSNDPFTSTMLFEFGTNIRSPAILFGDGATTSLPNPGAIFRAWQEGDDMFDHDGSPGGDFVLECEGKTAAVGGFLRHYNFPFADLHMSVRKEFRRRGFGSFLLQEVKKHCYAAGRVPAARCNIDNAASRATLLRAGFKIRGYMLLGERVLPQTGSLHE